MHDYYRQWRRAGIGERINTVLREKLRIPLGRDAQASAAIIDSQSVKTTEKGDHRLSWWQEGERVALVLGKVGNEVMIEAYFAGVARIEATIGVEDRASNREAKALHSFEGGLKLLRSKASL